MNWPGALQAATSTTIATVTTTSSTTSTTIPWPPPCGETSLDGRISATDALYVLRAAVGLVTCLRCFCDVDDSGDIVTSDALRVLMYAVGLPVVMACPACAPAVCGDGIRNRSVEKCDGGDDRRCPGLCQSDCTCAAPSCGDSIINQASEECDGSDDDLCPTLCKADCTCPPPECGNDVREQGELCDGTDIGDQTCASLGFSGGTLACVPNCDGFDSSACDLPAVLPPDPGSVAPAIDPTVPTDIKSATEFLYAGSEPVQYGMVAETIDVRRAALVRGTVRDRNGDPLPGVEVRVLFHPELGATQTRTDGRFDLVVNGGGVLFVTYEKDGYLPAQRKLDVPWQGSVEAPEVVLITPDPAATAIDLSPGAPLQVHQSSPETDAGGTRQTTLMFEAGTQAELVLADGSRRPAGGGVRGQLP